MSVKLRLKYSKTGRAKYISHLDLSVTMHRAFLRAETKLKYSEGFNPHPYISVALPLKVGDESLCELLDFAVAEDFVLMDGFLDGLNRAMPEGITAHDVYPQARKFSQIAWVEIHGNLYYNQKGSSFADKLKKRLSSDEIIISKKSKSGVSEINIAQYMKDVNLCSDENGSKISISACVSAQNPSITPDNIISTFDGEYQHLMPMYYSFSRVNLYDADFLPFY